ncbi:LOW QUALITY PROTEIN: tumor necrosis factor ligand superfamily member 6 [Sphaerodactylus townsendi]|uniref:LOW QUALITY PROTEIN: tumor necrosis factor ligand superfamily member 6 n=1 Tax=Sphaerodactylus townsendi TaxID=933632 RepID=UPI0020264B65|nr:LOW QUALITY PROTEIN: tumor necrosis factor ligand superfamily member 6 [Sphaerodactylus townsendi]
MCSKFSVLSLQLLPLLGLAWVIFPFHFKDFSRAWLRLLAAAVQAGRSYLASRQWVEALRFSSINQKRFIAVGAVWGDVARDEDTSLMQPLSRGQWQSVETSQTGRCFPAMQQNPPSPYPQVFWTNNSAVLSPNGAPVGLYHSEAGLHQETRSSWPVPDGKRQRPKAKDAICLCFLVVFMLLLLALTGVGLVMFQIYRLQKELELAQNGHTPQPPEKLKGFLNRTTEKIVKRRAHLTGKVNQKSLPLEWDNTYGHAFVSGVRYENRGLVIEEAGLYFVYSKVFFRGGHCTNQALDHMVFKRNPVYSGYQVLMGDRKMNYCVTRGMWSSDSYLGALFNLSRQDSLYVNVSELSLVNYEEPKTFFGLYML